MREEHDIRKRMVLPANLEELSDKKEPLDRLTFQADGASSRLKAFIEVDLGYGQRNDCEIHDVTRILSIPGHSEALFEGLRIWMRSGSSRLSRDSMRLSLTEGWCAFAEDRTSASGGQVSMLALDEIKSVDIWGFIKWLNRRSDDSSKPIWSKSTRRIRFLAIRKVLEALADYQNEWTAASIKICKMSVMQQTHWPGVAESSVPVSTLSQEHLAQIIEAAEKEVAAAKAVWEEGQLLVANGREKLIKGRKYSVKELRADHELSLAWMADRYTGLLPMSQDTRYEDRDFHNLVYTQNYGQGLDTFRKYLYLSLRRIMPFFVVLLARTRWNVSTLAGLKISDIQTIERFGEPAILLEPPKPRAHYHRQSVTLTAGKSSDALSNISVLELVKNYTDRIRADAVPADRATLLLANPDSVKRIVDLKNIEKRAGAFSDFCSENGLGFFNPSQIRPTIIDLIVRNSGSVIEGAKAANHKSEMTTARRYLRFRTKERFKARLGSLVMLGHRWASSSGKIDPRHLGDAADKFAATPGFHCLDPYDSPIVGQKNGRLCSAYGRCATCPMMLFAVEQIRDVINAMAVAKSIEATRYNVTTETWLDIWEPELQAIRSILKQVPAQIFEEASSIPSPVFPDPS